MGVQDYATLASAMGVGSIVPWGFGAVRRLVIGEQEKKLTRIESLEELVDALRRALDKGRLREDALAQVLGVLIFGLKHVEEVSPPIADSIERAVEILESAQDRLVSITGGNDGN